MRLVFMGHGPFAAPALETLVQAGHPLPLVVTRPDRPQGKHQTIEAGPVKVLAEQLGLPVEQPESVNTPAFIDRLRALAPELLVVADFGQILSRPCLATTKNGGINIHASLLPLYRGAAPIPWAIHDGATETGVSILRMTAQLDAGAVLLQERWPIRADHTSATLEAELATLGAKLAAQAVDLIAQCKTFAKPQDETRATKAPKLTKEAGLIDWRRSAVQIDRQIRAFIPWPMAYSTLNMTTGKSIRMQILQARPMETPTTAAPGRVVQVGDGEISVATGAGVLTLQSVKPAGRAAMSTEAFLRGHKITAADQFV